MSIGNRPPAAARVLRRRLSCARTAASPATCARSRSPSAQKWAEWPCSIRFGDTQVLRAATIEDASRRTCAARARAG
ncbi:MAG: hypothetical protein U0838_17620 [Chloroflexota bacterium]